MTIASDRVSADRTAIDKASDILRAFGGRGARVVGVSELSRRAGLSKSTVFRILGSLERNGLVERVGTAYRIGRGVAEIAAPAGAPIFDVLRESITPHLTDLFVTTRRTVQLAVLDGIRVVYLNKLVAAPGPRLPSRIGGTMPAYSTALGKVLLAANPGAIDLTLQTPRRAWTERTIVGADELLGELETVRASGIAHDRGESLDSLRCIAAPVRGRDGRVLAAVSASGSAAASWSAVHERALREAAYAATRTMSSVPVDAAAA